MHSNVGTTVDLRCLQVERNDGKLETTETTIMSAVVDVMYTGHNYNIGLAVCILIAFLTCM